MMKPFLRNSLIDIFRTIKYSVSAEDYQTMKVKNDFADRLCNIIEKQFSSYKVMIIMGLIV